MIVVVVVPDNIEIRTRAPDNFRTTARAAENIKHSDIFGKFCGNFGKFRGPMAFMPNKRKRRFYITH